MILGYDYINVGPCCQCKTNIVLPKELYEVAKTGAPKVTFYCPYGHAQVFAKGETEADKLRRERDRLAQQVAQRDDEIKWQKDQREHSERQLSAARGQITKIKKRSSAGTCPCCSRTFANMAEHMKHQHPEFVADGGAKVVPIKRKSA
jgi:DNA repair exonuclease SbcCD ATPase subunit